ncbi:MAG: hypothetical protein QF504_04750 [Nitrospinaceae bacterium]|nr:hypothetical protein [Nitrospinaceae bacterium]
MRRTGNNQRSSNRNNGPRRSGGNAQRNTRSQSKNVNGSNRNSSRAKESHTPHLWATASSSGTLTSHLSMSSRNKQNASGKNNNSNGNGKFSRRPGGKHRSNQGASDSQGHSRNRTYSDKPDKVLQNAQAVSDQQAQPEAKTNTSGIHPFDLFCAYHLGIGANGQYRPSNINEVANRFKQNMGTIRQILQEYKMDPDTLLNRDFDMALAQLDIQVAPEGVDRTELARNIYEDFLKAPIKKRDWKKILDEDRKENTKVFGRR